MVLFEFELVLMFSREFNMSLLSFIDNMPVTWCYNIESNRQYCNRGFPIGCYIDPKGRKSEGCYLSVST